MRRIIHFFDIKPGEDKEAVLHMLEKVDKYLIKKGWLERRTLKLLDAKAGGNPVESSEYINESLWSNIEVSSAAFKEMPDDINEIYRKFLSLIVVEKTVRYVDEG